MKRLLFILLLVSTELAAQVSGAGRIWQGAFPPATPSTAFSRNRDIWVDTVSNMSWIWTGTAWRESAVQIRPGRDGKDGQSIVGPQGDKGDKGDPGLNGNDGRDGRDGLTPTVTVGTVSTLSPGSNATVTAVPTTTGVSLSFGIPQGATGAQGPQGPAGSGSGGGLPTAAGAVRYVYNETELRNAVAAHANGSVNYICMMQNVGVTQPIDLPKSSSGLSKQLHLNLMGNTLFDNSANGLTYLIGRKPANQSEALNVMQSWAFIIENGALRGKGATVTGTLLDLGATFNSVAKNLRCDNAKKAIHYKFCLMGRIEQVVTTSISEESFFIDRGDWPDATNFNSQSNHSKIESCRVFNRGGNFAAFRVQGCSGIEICNSISEGGDPQWHVHFNSQASTVVKDFKLKTLHLESKSTSGGVYVRISSGFANIESVYSQYDNNLFVAESAGGPVEMHISYVPWLTSGTKFQSIGTTRWTFTDCFDGGNLFNASRYWVNNTLPTSGTSVFWNGNIRATVNR